MDWDLTSYFPQFNGPEMVRFKEDLQRDIASLQEKASALPSLDNESEAEWEKIFLQNEDILRRLSHLNSYISCLAAADTRNEATLKEEAAITLMKADSTKVRIELIRSIKQAPTDSFSSFINREAFKGAQHYLTRLREESHHTMDPDKETLAVDLGVDGIHAWGRLYSSLSGRLVFDMTYPDGRRVRVPMSQRRSLMDDPDRRVRKAAFEGGNAAWESIEESAAAILNAISGTRLTLNRHRAVEHFLDIALFQSGITRKTLYAMFEAVYSELDVPRRILRLKAKVMKTKGVAWYDLGAQLPIPERDHLPWEKAKTLVHASFAQAYPELGKYFQTIYDKNWIDWSPRTGKQPGGFCTGSLLTRESRIFMTYNQSMGDVLTLAHEAGHAFHSHVMRDLRPYGRQYPMTLAESASTFAEMILIDGMLKDPSISDAQKALVLDMETGRGAIYLMDIPVRYEFEKDLYEERGQGEISVSHLKELMIEAQQRVFGDILEEGGEDPYFWASKLHFYITRVTFYNFPYTFGFLLSRGLFAAFKKEEKDFLPRYEEFLRLAGSDTPENVARRTIGRDLESPDFWAEAIHSLDKPLNDLEAILPSVLPRSENL
ncbi:MAG: M3 family oligoendopeptidase [Candidatus Binatia bacterium]